MRSGRLCALVWALALLPAICRGQEEGPKQEIEIDAYRPSIVVFVSVEEAYKTQPYGWWSVWRAKKSDPSAHCRTPCRKTDLPSGMYTVIVYIEPTEEEAGLEPGDPKHLASDGVIIPNYYIDEHTRRSFFMKEADFREWNCLSCPWLYIFEDGQFHRKTEILKDAVGLEGATTSFYALDAAATVDGRIRAQIREEKDEKTFVDAVVLTIDGVPCPSCLVAGGGGLEAIDGSYLTLEKGERVDLEFALPDGTREGAQIVLEAHGYYEPDRCFLDRFFAEHSVPHQTLGE